MKWEHLEKLIKNWDEEKELELGSFSFSKVRDIGRSIEDGNEEFQSAESVTDELKRKIDKMRLKLDAKDWRELEKEIEKIMR